MFCKKCGNQIPENAEMCPACGTPARPTVQPIPQQYAQPVQQTVPVAEPVKGKKGKKEKAPKDPNKKGGKKKIIIPIIALVLVAAIVVGVIFAFQSPAVKVFNAAKKTIFESSELKITIVEHDNWSKEYYKEYYDLDIDENLDETIEIEVFFGEDIESSEGTIVEKYNYVDVDYDYEYDYYSDEYYYDNATYEIIENEYKYSYKNGKFYDDGEKIDEDLKDVTEIAEDFLKDEYDIDVNIIDVANMVIKGKIDEDGLTEVFNTIIVPNIEKVVNEYLETELELPEFEGLMGNIEDFVVRAYKEEVLTLEKTDSKNKGTTYAYVLDTAKLVECFLTYAQEEEDLNEYLRYAVDECKAQGYDEFDDVEDLVEMLEDGLSADVEIVGEITINGGRITYLTLGEEDEIYYTITIESKK